jgi:ATP-dependent RNA helicase RhlE
LVTPENRDTVRDIERVLGGAIERRILEEFDYGVAAPKRDNEFVRPPRQHVPARKSGGQKSGRQWGDVNPSSTSRPKKASVMKFR